MSSGRRATRPVRQLSLQQLVPRRQHIRRQKSAEDDCSKSLQIYANPIARDRLATNATDKPKVRVAWNDDRRDGLAQVEVVARQIPSRSRPTTGRSSRTYATTEKASILYSRQELAERLRLAWKHREQNKANIDIFLAHNVEERCESELSMSSSPTPLSTEKLDFMQDEERSPPSLKISTSNLEDQEKKTRVDDGDERKCERKLEAASGMIENDLLMKKDENVMKSVEKQGGENERMTNTQMNSDVEEKKKKTRINIDCTSLHLPPNNQLHPSTTVSSLKSENADPAKTNDNFSSARQKRASFQSGTNRAFLIPMTEKSPKEMTEAKDKIASAKSIEIRCASAATKSDRPIDRGTILARSSSTTSLEKTRRTNSAPPQRRNAAPGTRVQVNIVIDAPGLAEATDKSTVCGKMQDEKVEAVEKIEESSTKISRGERSIRSAPLKKRSKSAKRRFLASSGCKDEDREGRGKSSVDPRTSDVITMVSLVSSADSDSDAENSPGDDKLINELRSKLPTTPIIKTSINPNPTILRKPIKSVSFQRDSFDEEPTKDEKRIANNVQPPYFGFSLNITHGNGCKDSPEQDLAIDDGVVSTPTLTAVPALLISQDAEKPVPEAPLTDREKRCLAVPIGDLHDKKRKLLRTRSTPSRPIITEQTNNVPMEMKEQSLTMSRIDLVAVPIPPIDIPLSKVEHFSNETLPTKETSQEMIPSEPHFQTTKEKECWHLYRRMCDKGVCVSFDTVLRGMLTPTEYRLRQKECSQDLR